MLDISDYLPINTIVSCKFVKIISKYLSTISRRPIYTEMKSTHSLTQAKEIISFNETWKFGSTRNFRASIMADRSKALLTAFSLMICCHTAIWSLSLPLHRIEIFFPTSTLLLIRLSDHHPVWRRFQICTLNAAKHFLTHSQSRWGRYLLSFSSITSGTCWLWFW